MQSADIRLVPSRTISIGFDDKKSNYKQDTSSILTNSYDANVNSIMSTKTNDVDIKSFHKLSLSHTEMELLATTANSLNMNGSSHEDKNSDRLSHHGRYISDEEEAEVELEQERHDHHDDDHESVSSEQLKQELKEESEQEEEEEEEEEEPQLPSATADAMETYTNITENIYCGSATGKSIAEESMPCECKYRQDVDNPDAACGDDNYCINRMMFMECMVDDCPCERYCRNRRFQLRQYARVDVIRTDKKGFGLRALTDLPTNAFIMEYIGEVIPNHEFIRRTKEYEAAGLKHYYFMTLKTDEIIDATKKGCLARFINHSCNPNSVTQKWVVGKNMRIGIFTKRPIKAGQELTFDYKFERYGAVAQVCYCGEPNCKGFIGGSSKSELAKASAAALPTPIDDSLLVNEDDDDDDDDDDQDDQDDSDTAEAVTLTQKKMLRKMHRRRASEPLQDPREVQSFVKRMLDSVGKSHLVLKLLLRLESTDASTPEGKDVLRKFVRLHGLKMLKFWLGEWKNDPEILIKVLQVLTQLPLANKNGLEDCKMFEIVGRLTDHQDDAIRTVADQLLQDWDKLKSVYRIPKRTPTESSRKASRRAHNDSDDTETLSEVSADTVIPPRYDSSREFFDPDDDYFEYLSLDADAAEIQWKTDYLPQSAIPTAPRAMIDACIRNGYYGYGRPSRISTPSYPTYPISGNESNTAAADAYNNNSEADGGYDRGHSSYSSPYKAGDYKNSKLIESYSSNYNNASATSNYYDSPNNIDSPAGSINTAVPTAPAAATTTPKLPNNWRSAYAEDGTIYYYHRTTGKTQWHMPEEKVSTIEGVNQSDLEDLVEKTIQETEKRKLESARSASPAVSIASRNGLVKASPRIITPSVSRRGSGDAGVVSNSLDETELKKEVGKVVTKYLSAKKKDLWKGDKHLFKELARKITHHIVERETQSSRKIHAMNSSVRTKIEKFIDAHGAETVTKITRKRKHQAISSSSASKGKANSPSSVISEDSDKQTKSSSPFVKQPLPTPLSQQAPSQSEDNASTSNGHWNYDDDDVPMSPSLKRRRASISVADEETHSDEKQPDSSTTNNHSNGVADTTNTTSTTSAAATVNDKPSSHSTSTKDDGYYYSRRRRADSPPYSSSRDKLYGESSRYLSSGSAGEYVRPGYSRPPHYSSYSSSSYYRYPPPSSGSYYRSSNSSSRYYSSGSGSRRSSPPPYYHRPSASSSRRGSLSDDEMDRRRWD